jgi:uncharacterized membrane protein
MHGNQARTLKRPNHKVSQMKTLAYISFAIAVIGVWMIFHVVNWPPYGSVTYIAGSVLGVLLWQGSDKRSS